MGRIRLRRVGVFLIATFALSRSFDLFVARTVGHHAHLALGLSSLGMFVPGIVAIVPRFFFLRDGDAYSRRFDGAPRLIFQGFLVATAVYAVSTIAGLLAGARSSAFTGLKNLLVTLIAHVFRRDDTVLSFGLGAFGLLCIVPIVIFLFRDPVWEGEEGSGRP